MTSEQDRSAADSRKPRTKGEIEKILQAPQFRSEIMDGIVRAERGEPLIRMTLHEVMRKPRFDK